MPDEPVNEGRGEGRPKNTVTISLPTSVTARVKAQPYLADIFNAHSLLQRIIQGFQEIFAGDRAGGLEVGDLIQGVYPGIGSARPVDLHLLAQDELNRRLETLLDRRRIRLTLPAVKIRAVVRDDKA